MREAKPIDRKYAGLTAILRELDSVCIGYTGGVDSVFLAAVAVSVLGPDRVIAVTGRSAAYPAVQHRMALECARRLGIPHAEIETDELADPDYVANPSNRCYYCKSELWSKLSRFARDRGYAVVADGANADDVADHRPGAVAGREHGVRSPLLEAGLGKAEIRTLSRERGLPTWDQPAAPCLSSRIPYGLAVTPARLRQVERAEQLLRDRGFRELRVRHHGDTARIEVEPHELERAVLEREPIVRGLRGLGFGSVVLDVDGYRRGALNEALISIEPAGQSVR